jgi:hypothetical protein
MNKDVQFLAEAYNKVINEATKASPSNFSGQPVTPVGNFANSPIPKGYDAMQNMINQKLAAKEKSNDINVHPGDWGDEHQMVSDAINTVLGSGLIPSHALKSILEDAESTGYTGEGLGSVEEVTAKINAVAPALARAIVSFNEKGVQDS